MRDQKKKALNDVLVSSNKRNKENEVNFSKNYSKKFYEVKCGNNFRGNQDFRRNEFRGNEELKRNFDPQRNSNRDRT